MLVLPERLRTFYEDHAAKMAKYLAGSVVATGVSAATYAATFGAALLGSRGAALAASATGAVANYYLNRRWTWQRRGRGSLLREHTPYWATVVATALAAAVITGLVNGAVRDHVDSRTIRTVVNTTTFLAVYGVSFVLKYLIFDRVFRRAHAADRDRALVRSAAADRSGV